jgi:hypothetical protein
MKLLMALVPSECLEDAQRVIEAHDIHAYSEIPRVLGAGRGGRKLGTRAFPGISSMLLVIAGAEEADRVVEALRDTAEQTGCPTGIRVFALPAESVL